MPVPGHYLANRVRRSAVAHVQGYVHVVLNDVMPVFGDLNGRATTIRDDEYRRLCELPAPKDFDGDLSGLAERSHDKGMLFYKTMTDLRQASLALYAVGLFHSLEQHLKDVCDDPSFGVPPPGDTKLSILVAWYRKNFRLDLESLSNWQRMETLRLLANTVKHGTGDSERQLRKRSPELFEDQGLRELLPDLPDMYTSQKTRLPLAGQDLFISEAQFAQFGASTVAFTEEIADYFQNQAEHFFVDA